MKIPLFDIDYTLISRHRPPHTPDWFHLAIKKVHGVDVSANEIELHGRIDSEIIIELLKLRNVANDLIKEKLPETLQALKDFFYLHHHYLTYFPLPGAAEILQTLKDKHVPIGVLTGNQENIAWKKLELTKLKHFIDFGAFGNMAIKRAELIPIALERAKKFVPRATREDLVIIGDSLRDISCAKEAKVKIITTATGIHSAKELKKAGADLVVDSLNQKADILRFLQVV